TCIESALTTTPPVRRATSSASADLPLAVGPAIRTASFNGRPFRTRSDGFMSLVATLVSDPADAALDRTIVERAAEASGATRVDWLCEAVACDLYLPPEIEKNAAEQLVR